MEYYGSTVTGGPYMHLSGQTGGDPMLPSIATNDSRYHSAPPKTGVLGRSTQQPFRPATTYRSAFINPNVSLNKSMPEPYSMRTMLGSLDAIKIPPVFSSARNALYTRYTPDEWMSTNTTNYQASDRIRNAAERLRADAFRSCRDADMRTKASQIESGRKLGERKDDIRYWKEEVDDETNKMLKSIQQLDDQKRKLEKALKDTEKPLHTAQENLYHREKRQGVDLVHDNVERELIKEVDTIKNAQEKMRRTLEKLEAQLSLNRAAQHELEKDSRDKYSAFNLDDKAHQLKNSSRGIHYHDGIERFDSNVSVPESWQKFTEENLKRSQSERARAAELCNEIDNTINETSNDMSRQFNNVNNSFAQRTQEATDARNKIQVHLGKTLQEIFDTEKTIEFIKKTIQDKEAPLKVAQTRLDTRVRRPNVEACRDPVHHKLVAEVHELRDTVEELQKKLHDGENALQHLLRTKSVLEEQLSIKNNSIFIDSEKCMGQRKIYPITNRRNESP